MIIRVAAGAFCVLSAAVFEAAMWLMSQARFSTSAGYFFYLHLPSVVAGAVAIRQLATRSVVREMYLAIGLLLSGIVLGFLALAVSRPI